MIARATALLMLLSSLAARAAPPAERLAVIVGANLGAAADAPLRYAESDARAFRNLIVELGDARPDRALLVVGGKRRSALCRPSSARCSCCASSANYPMKRSPPPSASMWVR